MRENNNIKIEFMEFENIINIFSNISRHKLSHLNSLIVIHN